LKGYIEDFKLIELGPKLVVLYILRKYPEAKPAIMFDNINTKEITDISDYTNDKKDFEINIYAKL
jgi:hypothetical protein